MIRILLFFILVFASFYYGIDAYRKLTNKERWTLTKLAGYSIICSVLSVTVLTVIVILF